jgi:peptide deformylase
MNRNGEIIERRAEGLAAVAVCHEIDHLDGILYIDKMTRLDEGDKASEDADGGGTILE